MSKRNARALRALRGRCEAAAWMSRSATGVSSTDVSSSPAGAPLSRRCGCSSTTRTSTSTGGTTVARSPSPSRLRWVHGPMLDLAMAMGWIPFAALGWFWENDTDRLT